MKMCDEGDIGIAMSDSAATCSVSFYADRIQAGDVVFITTDNFKKYIPVEWIERRIKDLMQEPTETDEPWFPITHAEIVILEDLIDDWEKENEID